MHLPDEENHLTLDGYLCGGNGSTDSNMLQSNTTVVLAMATYHEIAETSGLCIVENITNVTITSEGDLSVIKCVGNSTAGFVFIKVFNLEISNVKFDGCGAALNDTGLLGKLNDFRKSEPRYRFDSLDSVTLMFVNCLNLSLYAVDITNYLGFGMILSNVLGNIEMDHISITDAVDHFGCDQCNGSGLLVIYNHNGIESTYNLRNVWISNGYTAQFNDGLIGEIDAERDEPLVKVAAGLSIIISEYSSTDQTSSIHVCLENLSVGNNSGGGVVFVYINVKHSSITVDTANISSCLPGGRNSRNKIGESLTVYFVLTQLKTADDGRSLLLKNIDFETSLTHSCRRNKNGTIFEKAEELFSLTSVLVRAVGDYVGQRSTTSTHHKVVFSNVHFTRDFSSVGADGKFGINMFVFSFDSILMTLHDVTSFNISCTNVGDHSANYYSCDEVGSLAFIKMKDLKIVNGNFSEHTSCSALYVQDTNVKFTGNITISGNRGVLYGAIQLVHSSRLLLTEPLTMVMENNEALYGSAIYVYYGYTNNCSIQFHPKHPLTKDNYTDINVTLSYKDNRAAIAGDTIYAYPLHHCHHTLSKITESLVMLLLNKMNPPLNRNNTEVSSPASMVCLCDDNKIPHLPCRNPQSRNFSLYAGQKIGLSMVAADGGSSVYGTVTARFTSVPKGVKVYIREQDVSSSLESGSCTTVDYIIYHDVNSSQENVTVVLELAATFAIPRVFVYLTLKKCPNGFRLVGEVCECIKIYKDFVCHHDGNITHLNEYWVGYTSDKHFGYSKVCPSGFCNVSLINTTIVTNLDKPSPMCNGGRTGTMCTLCPKGKSVVFGSVNCKECSNWYIATILFYGVCGLLLVVVTFLLQLTVRVGTINGLIFYANLFSTGFTLGYLLQVNSNLYLLRIFAAFINLNLGFPLCFYDGMNEEVKLLLQFVFPVYVWIIIGAIIYASRHSIKLSKFTGKHSVAVLATLLQLSYSKIMTNITESFACTPIVTEDGNFTVWFSAGIAYATSLLHVLHMFISIIFLFLFIIPYTLMITFAPFLAKYHVVSRYMPFLDVVYAPYKEKWRCWFGVRLCLLVVLLICRASLSGHSFTINLVVQLVLVTAFVFLQLHFKPFKKLFIHLLDVFFMLNFCACAFFTITVRESKALFDVITFLVSSALVAFLGIIAYHIYFVYFKKISCIKKISSKLEGKGDLLSSTRSRQSLPSNQTRLVVNTQCKHGTFDQLREPILDFADDSDCASGSSIY